MVANYSERHHGPFISASNLHGKGSAHPGVATFVPERTTTEGDTRATRTKRTAS